MIIHLIRHGQKHLQAGDPGLTYFGQRQAEATAKYFQNETIDKIIASPLLRTQQTAAAIAQTIKLEVETDHRLLERANWEPGTEFAQFVKMWREASNNRQLKPVIGDSSIQAGQRLETVINELIEQELKEVIFVSHGGVITDFLRNIFTDELLIQKSFGSADKLRDTYVPECSITTLKVISPNQFELRNLCQISHLKLLEAK